MTDELAPDDPLKGKFLLDDNGKPIRTADGGKIPLAWFDGDPTDVPETSDEQVDADIEMLGLSEFLPEEEIKEKQAMYMEEIRQLEEVLSWRIVAELWRRFPKDFTLIEAHPGGGLSDCLALVTKTIPPQFAIDVNRDGGSVHIHKEAFGLVDEMTLISDWVSRMLQPKPERFLDEIAQEARLVPPMKLPPSTPETIVYRFIADFLTHSVGRLDKWECRNGYEDTSGYGGGKREHLFKAFASLRNDNSLRHAVPFLEKYEYGFWFLLKNDTPVLCLDTSGIAYLTDGNFYNLESMYKDKRKIWPLIFEVAEDVLP